VSNVTHWYYDIWALLRTHCLIASEPVLYGLLAKLGHDVESYVALILRGTPVDRRI